MPWDEVRPAKYYAASAPIGTFETAKIEHKKRIKKNKLFQLILNNIDSKQKNSVKREISLLETNRELERKEMEEAKKAMENMIRQERGLPPINDLKNISDMSDNNPVEPVDVLLNEAAEILNDLIVPHKNIDVRTVKTLKY